MKRVLTQKFSSSQQKSSHLLIRWGDAGHQWCSTAGAPAPTPANAGSLPTNSSRAPSPIIATAAQLTIVMFSNSQILLLKHLFSGLMKHVESTDAIITQTKTTFRFLLSRKQTPHIHVSTTRYLSRLNVLREVHWKISDRWMYAKQK